MKTTRRTKSVFQERSNKEEAPILGSRVDPKFNKSFDIDFEERLEQLEELHFVPWGREDEDVRETSLSFIEDDKGICIRHSCNGLLLCSGFRCHEEDRQYYICKPTTKQYLPLPKPHCKTVYGISIAYDPNKSPHYQVVCISDSKVSSNHRQIKIYSSSSSTCPWRDTGNPFVVSDDVVFNRGVYWNGALHWVGRGELSLRFDVEKEIMLQMPMPPIPEQRSERRLGYFGESGGHLYLIEIYGPHTTVFDVMEMSSDYSGWLVKYHVDLHVLTQHFSFNTSRYNVEEIHRYAFSVLHILHQQEGDVIETILAIHIPANLILYNLQDHTFMELPDMLFSGIRDLGLVYNWERVHPYNNPLCYL